MTWNIFFSFLLFSGDFKFDKIGSPYNASVPVFAMRSVPALTGSMLIPLVYMIMLQLNYSQWTAALAGFLFLFGMKFAPLIELLGMYSKCINDEL